MAGPWDRYQAAPAADGPWAKYAQPAAEKDSPSIMDAIKQGIRDLPAGLVRGAASIGATLTTPTTYFDPATGQPRKDSFLERRAATLQGVDQGLTQAVGSNPDNAVYKVGKVGGEVAGTAGAGGAAAQVLRAAAPVATNLPRVANVVRAVETGGMQGGNLLSRSVGAGINGATQTGLASPEDVSAGAAIGAATPGVLGLAGKAGSAAGNYLRGTPADPQRLAAARAAQSAGYVIPPSDIRQQSAWMELAGGLSGKIKTAQEASAKNQGVTNKLAKVALGIPEDAPITRDALGSIRTQAGQAYEAIGQTGVIQPAPGYVTALDKIAAPYVKASQGFPNAKPSPVLELVDSLRSPQFDAASAVEKIKQLRTASDDAFRTGNTDIARASKAAAAALEDAIDGHLQQIGQPDLLARFRDARQLIAKTYTVEKALNSQTGDVSARVLAQQLKKGKPLSGGLRTAAETGEAFPKATQALAESPKSLSPLDMAFAGGGFMAQGPIGAAGLVARPAVRSALLSKPVQRAAASDPGVSMFSRLGSNPNALQLLYRTSPALAVDR